MTGSGILNADMAIVRTWLATGVRWWLGEMIGLVPQRWRRARASRLAYYHYDLVAGEFVPLAAADRAAVPPGAPVAVVLPPELTLLRRIDYPDLGPRDLANLIELDRDRIMPCGRDALLAARVLERANPSGSGSGRMQVEVAGLPWTRAEALALALPQAPRPPARILASAPTAGSAPPIDLLPALRRAGLVASNAGAVTLLWLAVGVLFLLNVGLVAWRDGAARDDLAAAVDQQQPAVSAARRLIARMQADDRIVAQTAAARASREPLAVLARIDAALPPGTWLERLSWQSDDMPGDSEPRAGMPGAIQLAGYHPPRTNVPGALRHAGLAVTRYSDTAQDAPTPLGEPFEAIVRLGKR